MALTDKNIVVTPNIGSSSDDPKVVFSGADSTTGAQNITLRIYPTDNGTLSFEGSNGQLFSITNSLSGTIYSVNDISGIPSIEVMDSGLVKLAQYGGNVSVGNVPSPTYKLDIHNGGATGAKLFRATYNNSNYLYGYADSGGTGITNSDPYTSGSLLYFNGGIAYLCSGSSIGLEVNGTSARSHIFYDRDDTGYYIDPNSSSKLNTLNVGDVYSTGWFRNYGTQGLYNQDYGTHFYALAGTSWGITGSGGAIELQFRSNHQSTVRGYVYGDTSSNFGLLNQNGSWKVRVNGSETEIYDYLYANDVRPYIIYDRNDTGYYVDPNSTSNMYKVTAFQGAKYTTSDWADGFRNTPTSGRCFHGDVSAGGPSGTWWFYDSMRHSNGSNYWGTQIAYGWEDNSNRILQRNISGNSFSGWVEYLNTGGRTFDGNLTMSGNITAYSDEKLKDDWKPVINDFVSKLAKVKSGSYTRKDSNERQAGISAQDIKKILPEVVFQDSEGFLSLAYGNAAMVSVVELAKAIKEQQLQIDKLLSLTASK